MADPVIENVSQLYKQEFDIQQFNNFVEDIDSKLDAANQQLEIYNLILENFTSKQQNIISKIGLKPVGSNKYILDTLFYDEQQSSDYSVEFLTETDMCVISNKSNNRLGLVLNIHNPDTSTVTYVSYTGQMETLVTNSSYIYAILEPNDSINIDRYTEVVDARIIDILPQLNIRLRDEYEYNKYEQYTFSDFIPQFIFTRYNQNSGLYPANFKEFYNLLQDKQDASLTSEYQFNDLLTFCLIGKNDGTDGWFSLTKTFLSFDENNKQFVRKCYAVLDNDLITSDNQHDTMYARQVPLNLVNTLDTNSITYEWFVSEQAKFDDLKPQFKNGSLYLQQIDDLLTFNSTYIINKNDIETKLSNDLGANLETMKQFALYICILYNEEITVSEYKNWNVLPNILKFGSQKPTAIFLLSAYSQAWIDIDDVSDQYTTTINVPAQHIVVIGNSKSMSVQFNNNVPEVLSADKTYISLTNEDVSVPVNVVIRKLEPGQQFTILAFEYTTQISPSISLEYGYEYQTQFDGNQATDFDIDIETYQDRISNVQCKVEANAGQSLMLDNKMQIVKQPVDRINNQLSFDIQRAVVNFIYVQLIQNKHIFEYLTLENIDY